MRYVTYWAKIVAIVAVLATISSMIFLLAKPPFKTLSEEESLEIALNYLRNSPTFKFDGIEESLEHVETLYSDASRSWEFIFTFQCRHAGYGDRTGKVLLQVITPHKARIVVREGEVVIAVLDDKWDITTQKMLPKP